MEDSNANGAAGPALPVIEPEEPALPPHTRPVSIRLPPEMLDQLRAASHARGMRGYQRLVKQVLTDWLRSYGDAAAPAQQPLPIPPPPVGPPRTRLQLRELLTQAIRRMEAALEAGESDKAGAIEGEIEDLRDELEDLDQES